MNNELYESKIISVKDAGYDEAWLQAYICNNPQKLNISNSELQLVARERIISSGGRLDILLQDSSDDIMYEVEVQLGDTDPSHIIRTIEYWDLIRKKYPLRQHYGVLIAERITKRFFNVISLLSNSIPIIAIQCQIVEIDNKRTIVFTKILDSYEEPQDLIADEAQTVDESYWSNMAPEILLIAKKVYNETKEIYQSSSIEYNKWSIAIKKNGYNQIGFNKRSNGFVHIELKYGRNKEQIFSLLENAGIPVEDKYNQARFIVKIDAFKSKIDLIKEIALLNIDWWKTLE